MLFVYSSDSTLVELCVELFKKNDKIKRLVGKKGLDTLKPAPKDVLIIDLESLDEKDLPEIDCPAMALAAVPAHAQAMRILQKGFRAYGNRYMHDENLIQAVRTIKSGQIWLPPVIITQMITTLPAARTQKQEEALLKNLTSREVQVAKWVANGLSNLEIGDKMFISTRTVKAHLTAIFKKTGCRDRLELATRLKY